MPVGIPQLLPQSISLGHVPNNAGDENALTVGDRAEADLDRELAAVFPQAPQLRCLSHWAGAGMSDETGTLAPVTVSEAFGHQDFYLLSHQFLPSVTEHPFSLPIHPNDLAVLIDNDHGIGCGLQKVVERMVLQRSDARR